MMKVVFIMVVHESDCAVHLKDSLHSIYLSASMCTCDTNVFIRTDGAISSEKIEIIRDARKYVSIDLFQGEREIGLTRNLNYLIQKTKGYDYIFRLDPDDLCLPPRIKTQIKYFEQNPDIEMIGSSAEVIDDDGKLKGVKKTPIGKIVFGGMMNYRNPIIHSSVCFRACFFEKYGFYDVTYTKSQDYALWSKALRAGANIVNLSDNLIRLRVTKQQQKRRKSIVNLKLESSISLSNILSSRQYYYLPLVLFKYVYRILR
jgi:hypothetical protein